MYVYSITFPEWEDSETIILSHPSQFSKEQFNRVCDTAKKYCIDYLGLQSYYSIIEKMSVILEEYGFIRVSVLDYNVVAEVVNETNKESFYR